MLGGAIHIQTFAYIPAVILNGTGFTVRRRIYGLGWLLGLEINSGSRNGFG